jgi:hypothetical protein
MTYRSLRCGFSNPQTIAIRIGEMDLATPGLVQELGSKLTCNLVEVIDPQVDEGVGSGISGVFREKQTRRAASRNRREARKAGFKSVLPFLLITQPGEPGHSPAGL